MNAIFWLLNGFLALVAVLLTVAVVQFQPKLPVAGGVAGPDARGGTRKLETMARPSIAQTQSRRLLSKAKLEPLWENSLFRPGRSEDLGGDPAGTPETGVKDSDMDLIGIGAMGTEAAAIISLPDRGRLGVKPGQRPGDPAAKAPPVKRVFKLGEAVLDTGYSVKEIRLDEVTLVRGEEERILKMKRGGAASKGRREQAQRVAASRPPPAMPVSPLGSGKIPVPPPPPPLPMPAFSPPGSSAPAETAAREERLKQAIEARRQMLEQQAKQKP